MRLYPVDLEGLLVQQTVSYNLGILQRSLQLKFPTSSKLCSLLIYVVFHVWNDLSSDLNAVHLTLADFKQHLKHMGIFPVYMPNCKA